MSATTNIIDLAEGNHHEIKGVKAQRFMDISQPIKVEKTTTQLRRDHLNAFIPNLELNNEVPVFLATLQETVTPQRNCLISKTNWTLPESEASAWDLRRGRRTGLANITKSDPDNKVIELAEDFIYRVNPNEGLYTFLWQSVFYYYGFGNVYIELQKVKVSGETFFNVFNHDPTRCLIKKGGKAIGISPQWDSDYLRENPATYVPVYPEWQTIEGVERTILHCKVQLPRRTWYGLPDSITSVQNQKATYHIDKYNLQEFENGFLTFTIMQFVNDNMSEEQAEAFLAKLKNKFTGEDRERFLAQVVGDKSDLAEVHEFGKFQGSFIDYDKHIESKIIKSNNWYELLTGNPDNNSLGDGGRIHNTIILAFRNVIVPTIRKVSSQILDVIFSEYLKTKGINEQYYLKILNSIPKDFYDFDINKIATRNEGREVKGFTELVEGGEEFIDNGTNNNNGSNNESTD